MPIYEYRCRNGHSFEVFQSMAEDPVSLCERCEAPVERVFHPIAVHFKGSGFYTTDYARKGAGKDSTDGGSEKDAETKADSGSDSDSKPKSKSGSDSKPSEKASSTTKSA